MFRRSFQRFFLVLPFLLAACGGEWEVVRVTDVAPYGNSRTAGSAIAYVRVKMMPEKDLNLKSVIRDREPSAVERSAEEIEENEKILEELSEDMDKIFSEAQRK